MSIEGMKPEDITRLATWADSMLSNAETRKSALEMTRKVNPQFRHPELELDSRIADSHKLLKEEAVALRKELEIERIERSREAKKSELSVKGFDIEAVEKVMTDNGIGSYETAMKFMRQEAQLAPATSANVSSGNAQMPDGFKDILKNPTRWARDMAADLLTKAKQGIAI